VLYSHVPIIWELWCTARFSCARGRSTVRRWVSSECPTTVRRPCRSTNQRLTDVDPRCRCWPNFGLIYVTDDASTSPRPDRFLCRIWLWAYVGVSKILGAMLPVSWIRKHGSVVDTQCDVMCRHRILQAGTNCVQHFPLGMNLYSFCRIMSISKQIRLYRLYEIYCE